jgi:hypothetical protein
LSWREAKRPSYSSLQKLSSFSILFLGRWRHRVGRELTQSSRSQAVISCWLCDNSQSERDDCATTHSQSEMTVRQLTVRARWLCDNSQSARDDCVWDLLDSRYQLFAPPSFIQSHNDSVVRAEVC